MSGCQETRCFCWLLSMDMAEPDGVLRKPLQLLGGGWAEGARVAKSRLIGMYLVAETEMKNFPKSTVFAKGLQKKTEKPKITFWVSNMSHWVFIEMVKVSSG